MAKFEYVGMNEGKQVKGEIEATNKEQAALMLRKKRIRTTSLRSKGMDIKMPKLFSGIKLQDISRFTRQFAAMVNAGLPLVQCLDVLGAQTESVELGTAVKQVSSDIQGGNNLAESMAKHPKAFNALYCNMVAAGEQSGNLDGVLNRLAEYQEKADALRRKIKGAMTYPAIVAIVAAGATVAMLAFVIPTFAQMFIDMGGSLPTPTKVVMYLSDLLLAWWWLLIIVSVGSTIAFLQYYKTPGGRVNIDKLKLKAPVLGDLERKSSVSRFAQTLSTLLSSGVSIIEALSITAKTAGNKVLEIGIMRTVDKIQGGLSIAEPLQETGVFPPMVIHMISVGEKTGDLSGMLKKVSEFYAEEVDAAVEALTSVIEPIMIVLLAIIIGGMLIAMYLPMFDMVGMVG
ncbi:MAG: type II secretion system F family protein [Chitinispirillales bacterium]|jgi:type IV pilus assembly protein PilC|nr:type II secretion system F family protein [Chitinispirillales bacterium]